MPTATKEKFQTTIEVVSSKLSDADRAEIMATVIPKLYAPSLEVVKKRHLLHDENGNVIETPQEMFLRVAEHMAKTDLLYDARADIKAVTREFYEMMAKMEFLPGSRILFEAGNDHSGQLASCFVLPLEDNLESIFQTLEDAAVVHQRNGGCGYNFSKIRPKGDSVKGIPHVAAGPIHYLRTFSVALSQVLQGAKRPGGNMAVLNVDHPDVEEFIEFKDQDGLYANFNVSVGVTDAFMEAVRRDEDFALKNPRNGETVKTVRARELFDKITEHAWKTGDPGMIFLDRVEEANPTPEIGVMDATNPCGEQPLLPYESCNLGSLVLSNHVTADGQVDWAKLKSTMHKAVHYMDNMLDVNNFPLEQIEQMVKYGNRKIGIGIFGFAQMLYKLNIPYDSEQAIELAEEIMRVVNEEGHKASGEMARARGNFPNWEKSIYKAQNKPMRNATVTTIAPTGTLSMVPSTSSGVEPVFSLVNIRRTFFEDTGNRGAGRTLVFVDPVFEERARAEGFYSEELMEQIASAGTLQHIDGVPERIKHVFRTAHDVSPDWHVRIQAAFQKHTDNAVSKTINFPNHSTVNDVRRAYILAYETRCKGITIYRDGSKQHQILNTSKTSTDHAAQNPSEPVAASAMEPVAGGSAVSLSANAMTVLEKRALLKDENGTVIETPAELFRRTAELIASPEKRYGKSDADVRELADKFTGMMSRLEFISGQALRNSKDPHLTLSACLVLPIDDSIDAIMQAIHENVVSHKSTIGTGFNFSKVRSRNTVVGSTGEVAAGPVAFLKAMNETQGTIRTKGGRKQGAMAILNVDHPDIEEFIQAKDAPGELDHFNISVGATDAFMDAVKNDADWNLVDPHSKEVVKTIKARGLFRTIAQHAWVSGDPGMIFLDPVDRDNPTPTLGKLDATNPCGEQPLLPYETCNLGSVVLSRMVAETRPGHYELDWEKLKETVHLGVRFLDNTIDVNTFPLDKIRDMTTANRRIGLGVMGFADLLVQLEIPYNSEEAVQLAEEIMEFVNQEAHDASEAIAKEKNSFPNFNVSTWVADREAMRNSAVTTIAPTGYTSIVAGCSSGIEPIFALAFQQKGSMGGHDQTYINDMFEEVARREGFYSDELMQKIGEKGDCQGLFEVPERWQRVFVTSHHIAPEWHVRIQAAFQKHTDNAVSKTINFPNAATVEDIEKVYMQAWDSACKGVTIFRDGSKNGEQVLHIGTKEAGKKDLEEAKESVESMALPESIVAGQTKIIPRERPEVLRGFTYKLSTSYGNMFITINEDDDGNPFEVFATIGKPGGVFQAKSEAICRLASLALRSGVDVEEIIKQLKGIRGPMPSFTKYGMVLSIPDGIAQILEQHVKRGQGQLELKYEGKSDKSEMPAANVVVAPAVNDELLREPKYEMIREETGEDIVPAVAVEEAETLPSVQAELDTTTVTFTSEPAKEEVKIEERKEVTTITAAAQPAKKTSRSIADLGFAPECPDCGNILEFGEGCMVCRSCGYSKCG
ncbi:MAG: vitamin B12-dependent ribonucleotide reductase [Candidatus Kerfeldbacteria bacterium]|nr:vitamin B12-dependent ribonucleotide reductase [Candidatus Kerfeldbacteria bacterium]